MQNAPARPAKLTTNRLGDCRSAERMRAMVADWMSMLVLPLPSSGGLRWQTVEEASHGSCVPRSPARRVDTLPV
jgi:hypothetical protein